ncbi:MAG: hypothetical protein R3Y63_14935 [Eubacteriales bacterium]
MENNCKILVNFENNQELCVKCTISFETSISEFIFSLNKNLTIDSIDSETDVQWGIVKEWEPQWAEKSNVIKVASNIALKEITISYHGEISGWCNVLEERRIALSMYSAWYIFETSLPLTYLFYMKNMEDYNVINGRYDDSEKAWVYGETDHDIGNLIALKKDVYLMEKGEGIEYYYFNKAEKSIGKSFTQYYQEIFEYYNTELGSREKQTLRIVSIDREDGSGAYFRKELVVIDKMPVIADEHNIRMTAIRFLGHELAHNWFMEADTSSWEDWLNETGAEWSLLSFAHKIDEKQLFEKQIAYARNNYMDSPVIKPEDLSRPSTGVHSRGVMLFYEIFQKYGIDKINVILKVLANLEITTTSNFLLTLREIVGDEIPDLIERGLKLKDYTEL